MAQKLLAPRCCQCPRLCHNGIIRWHSLNFHSIVCFLVYTRPFYRHLYHSDPY